MLCYEEEFLVELKRWTLLQQILGVIGLKNLSSKGKTKLCGSMF